MDDLWAFNEVLRTRKYSSAYIDVENLPKFLDDYFDILKFIQTLVDCAETEEEMETPTAVLVSNMCHQVTQVEQQAESFVAELRAEKDKLVKTGKLQSVALEKLWDEMYMDIVPSRIINQILSCCFCSVFHGEHKELEDCQFFQVLTQLRLAEDALADDEDENYTTCSSESAEEEESSVPEVSSSDDDEKVAPGVPEVENLVGVADQEESEDLGSLEDIGDEDGDFEGSDSSSVASDTTQVISRMQEVF